MKKIYLATIFSNNSAFGQSENAQNELKINMSNLIGFKWLDVGYERILNEESSIGFGTLISLDHTPKVLMSMKILLNAILPSLFFRQICSRFFY